MSLVTSGVTPSARRPCLRTSPSVADFDPQRVEENQRIHELPEAGSAYSATVSRTASVTVEMETGQPFQAIKLEQMPLDLANGHARAIHRHDLLVEARKQALIAGDELRMEQASSRSRGMRRSSFEVSVSTLFFE